MRALLILPAACVAAHGWSPVQPCETADHARALAEVETGGEAVVAMPILQTDATRGWLVDVHMPGRDKGWRCIVDRDLSKVRSQEPIPNPARRRTR